MHASELWRALPRSFYDRDPRQVARELLGQFLLSYDGRDLTGGRIVETEAYLGEQDPGSHASRGRTERNEQMWGPPGTAYVYFIYGAHHCLNIVTWPEGVAGAVLIRAIEPTVGVEVMARRRGVDKLRLLAAGPGRLCQALGITLADNGVDMTKPGRLWVAPGKAVADEDIEVTTRIGLPPGKGDDLLLRYLIGGSRWVSVPPQRSLPIDE